MMEDDAAANPHKAEFYDTIHMAAKMLNPRYTLQNITQHNTSSLLTTERFDVVIFPGGSGGGQAKALGEAGMAAVRAFVQAGGGYIGTCGGAFLALQHLLLYGSPAPPTVEPWMRGHGPVSVEFTPDGVQDLGLDTHEYLQKNVTIEYWQGPIVRALPRTVAILASFRTEIHHLLPNKTTGNMVNTPAVTSAQYGEGTVVLNSPHPEIPPEPDHSGVVPPGRQRPEVYCGELAYVLGRSSTPC